MKIKFKLFFLCGVVLASFLINSCQKTKQDYIATLFTGGQWQLSSLTVTHYVGASTVSVDTLNANCNDVQAYTFHMDNTCSYTNFNCITQAVTGHWSLSEDRLFLHSDIVCQDTTAAKSSQPFQTAKIINLGQYSLVLQTGDLETYFSPTQVRTVTQYGFVRVKTQ
jgi:hypothetical protein